MTSTCTPRFHEKREAILDGAARLFNRNGIKGGTLSDVARGVGLITNSITYYYRKKEDLVTACLLRSVEVINRVAAAAAEPPDLEARVRSFVAGYVGMLADINAGRHPELVHFGDVRALTPPHDSLVFEAYTDMFRGIRRLLKEGAHEDRRGLNAQSHLLLSLVLWTRAWITQLEPDDYALAAAQIADVLLHGLAAAGQPWPEFADMPSHLSLVHDGASVTDAYLRAATRLVNDQGYRGASVDRISAELNLTKGSFYHHHETKEDLISACFDRTFDVIRCAQKAAADQPGSGWQRLARASCELVRYQLGEHGPLLRVSAWTSLPEALRSDKFLTMNRLGERFRGFIVDGMVDGSVRPLDQVIAAQLVNGMINAAAELRWWVPGVDASNASLLYARPLLAGLLAHHDVPRSCRKEVLRE